MPDLSDRELDQRCAEVMGWTEVEPSKIVNPGGCVGLRPGQLLGLRDSVPHYSTDLNTAAELEAEIERRGPMRMLLYNTALGDAVGVNEDTPPAEELFRLIHATARQRALAFLEAMENA